MTLRIPLFELEYDERERSAVTRVLDSRWLTMGDETAAFEEEFASFAGTRHAIAVSSGTTALHLAVKALGIGPGDEVIVPDLTFAATAHAVIYEGASPVLADVKSEDDLTIGVEDLRRLIGPRTKAIIVMHYGGYPGDVGALRSLADDYGLAIVEDAAHAPGAECQGRRTGSLGRVGCFSFFSNKNIATGEGGMLTTDDDEIAERARLLRSHGMNAQTLDRHRGHAWGYDVLETGYNYRLTEIEAALGRVQLAKVLDGNERRRRVVAWYRRALQQLPDVAMPFSAFDAGTRPRDSLSAAHIAVILLPEGTNRASVAKHMREAGIGTSVHYRPLDTFTNSALASAAHGPLSVVRAVEDRLLTLPLWPGMSESMVGEVVTELGAGLQAAR